MRDGKRFFAPTVARGQCDPHRYEEYRSRLYSIALKILTGSIAGHVLCLMSEVRAAPAQVQHLLEVDDHSPESLSKHHLRGAHLANSKATSFKAAVARSNSASISFRRHIH